VSEQIIVDEAVEHERASHAALVLYVAHNPVRARKFARANLANQPTKETGETMDTIQRMTAALAVSTALAVSVLSGTAISALFGNGPWAL